MRDFADPSAIPLSHLPASPPIPGLTDIRGLYDLLLDHIPDLAGECRNGRDMDAVCGLEAQTLRGLAYQRATNLAEIALKLCALVVRLRANTTEPEIPEGDATLLCSALRDLVLLDPPTALPEAA